MVNTSTLSIMNIINITTIMSIIKILMLDIKEHHSISVKSIPSLISIWIRKVLNSPKLMTEELNIFKNMLAELRCLSMRFQRTFQVITNLYRPYSQNW